MNYILQYIGWTLLALVLYLIFAPIPKLLYLKFKHGNQVDIYYFPLIGLLGQVILDGIFKADVFYSQKYYKQKNPNLKLHISSDLKGGVHYSLVDPQLKRLIFSEQEAFKKMEGMPFQDTYMSQGLLFQQGHSWSTSRKMLTQHFTYEEIKKMIHSLKEECQQLKLVDGAVDILSLTKILTSNSITKAFFGLNNNISNLGTEVNDNMELMMKFLMNPLVLLRCFALKMNKETTPRYLMSGLEKKFLAVLKGQKQQIINSIQERMKQQNPEDNILTTLAKEIQNKTITMEEATHQYFTLLIAGIDSTSHTLKNCCYALAKHVDSQTELRIQIQKVIDNFDNLDSTHLTKIPFLDNFINETLRYYTPVPSLFNRVAIKDIQVGPFLFQKGQSVDINFMMSNFDPALFKEPLQFNVNRWITPPKDNYAFTPFSAGTRNCIGQHLALLELKTMIIYLVLNYQLSLSEGKITLGLGNMYGPTRKDFLSLKKLK